MHNFFFFEFIDKLNQYKSIKTAKILRPKIHETNSSLKNSYK